MKPRFRPFQNHLDAFLKTKQNKNRFLDPPGNPLSQKIFSEVRVYVLIDFPGHPYAH